MYRLTDAYDSDRATPFATAMLTIGTAVFFSVGLFLILNSHDHNQSMKLQDAASKIAKIKEVTDNKDVTYDSLTVDGETNLSGDVTADSDLSVGGQVSIAGDTAITGSLDVTGKTKNNANLNVAGDTSLASTLDTLGRTDLKGSLDVAGAVTAQAGLTVAGDTSFDGGLLIAKGASFAGSLDVAGASTISSSLAVTGDTTFDGTQVSPDGSRLLGVALAVQGAVNVSGSFEADGVVTLASTLNVAGDATFDSSQIKADGSGLLTNNGFTLQGPTVLAGDLEVDGVAYLQSSLALTGSDSTASFNAAITNTAGTALLVPGTGFTLQGVATLAGDLEVDGTTWLKGALSLTGVDSTATFDSSQLTPAGQPVFTTTGFIVQQAVTLAGDLDVSGTAELQSTLALSGTDSTLTIDGTTVNVANSQTILLTTAAPTLTVTGAASLAGDLTVNGYGSIGDLTMSSVDSTLTFDGTGTSNGTDVVSITGGSPALAVNGATQLAGDLSVLGMGSLDCGGGGTLCLNLVGVESEATFDNTYEDGSGTHVFPGNALTVNGLTQLGGSLTADGTTLLNDGLNVSGGAEIDGNLYVHNASGMASVIATTIQTDQGITFGEALHTNGHGGDTIYDAATALNHSGASGSKGCDSAHTIHLKAVEGGVVTDSECLSVSTRSTTPSGSGANCDEGVQHIRITEVTGGLITGSTCANNDGSTSPGNSTNYDLAENYPSNQTLTAGDVVSIDPVNPEYVVKASSVADETAIGIVSTAPGVTLGSAGPGYPIALSGRVPVKVTNEGGAIAVGDYLTSASTPGYAKKAGATDKTIGQALEAFSGTTGSIKVFVSVDRSTPSMQSIVQNTLSAAQGYNVSFAGLNVSGASTLSDLQVTGIATIKDLTVTGDTHVANLFVNGHIVGNDDTRGSVTITSGSNIVHHDFANPYSKTPAVVASPTSQAVLYTVTPTTTGFDIKMPANATADTSFDYLVQE